MQGVGIAFGFFGDGDHGFGKSFNRFRWLRLGRLDHKCLVDDQREVDRRRVEAVVDQALGDVVGTHPMFYALAGAGENDLVQHGAVVG